MQRLVANLPGANCPTGAGLAAVAEAANENEPRLAVPSVTVGNC